MINNLIKNLIKNIGRVPSISKRNAEDVALFILSNRTVGKDLLASLSESMSKIKRCNLCNNLSLEKLCKICQDSTRENRICVVHNLKDLIKIEKSKKYRGKYHILGGKLSPLKNYEAEKLDIDNLIKRVKQKKFDEIVLALDLDVEGELTSNYILTLLDSDNNISKIAPGLPLGSKIDLADVKSIGNSIENRKKI